MCRSNEPLCPDVSIENVGRTTTVKVRDMEVRRDGGIFARLVGV